LSWWERGFFRALQFNIEDPYGFYADRITAEGLIEAAKRARANMLVVFARDAWGRVFYTGSTLYPKHPTSRLDLGRLVELARREGIRVVVMAAHTANRYLYRKHPSWAQRSRDGEVIVLEHYPRAARVVDPHWPQICPNSPALEEYFIPEVEEALRATGADGLLLDSFRYLPDPPKACFCNHCRTAFAREHGMELPERADLEDESFRVAWEWRYRVTLRALSRLREAAKRAGGEVLFFYNSHPAGWAGRGNIVVSKARGLLDAVFAEASEADVRGPGLLTIVTKLSRALLGEDKPVFVSRNLFYDLRPVQSPPPATIRLGIWEIVAAGGHPIATMFSSQFFEDPRSLDALAEVYEILDRIEDYLVGAEQLQYMAILFDPDTHDKYYWARPEYYVGEVEGFAFIGMHRRLPWSFLSTQDLIDYRVLERFPVIVAAGTSVLSDEAADQLRYYVEMGGNLVVTHEFGVMRPDYTYREALALQEVLGVKYEGKLSFGFSYLHLDLPGVYEELWKGLPRAVLLGDHSSAFAKERVEPKLGEIVRARPSGGRVLARARMGRSAYGYEYTLGRSSPAPDSVLELAGIVESHHGEGRTLYYAVRLGAHYSRLGLPDYAELFTRPLLSGAPQPPVRVDAPETVQAEFYRKDDALIVHLVNHTYNQRILSAPTGPSKQSPPSFDPTYRVHPARGVVPVTGVRLEAVWDGGPARAWNPVTGEEYQVDAVGGRVVVEVPRLVDYALVVLEPGG